MKQQSSISLFSYWKELYARSGIPERSSIEPMSIRQILGDTFILETTADGTTTYRLAGTRLCAMFGNELKGKNFTQHWRSQEQETIANILESVTTEEKIALFGCIATSQEGRSLSIETMVLPLRHNGEKAERQLGVTSPLNRPYWLGMDPIAHLSLSSFRVIDPAAENKSFMSRFTVTKGEFPKPVTLPHKARPEVIQNAKRVKHLTVLEGGRANNRDQAPLLGE